MKKALVILMLLGLTGCADLTQMICKDALIIEKKVDVDPRVLEPCEDLPTITTTATWEDILMNHADTVQKYVECRKKQEASTTVIKQFANLP